MKQRFFDRLSAARADAQRGAVIFLVVMTVLIVMVAGAIAVDLSAVSTRGQSLQNAADSAALAGVQAFRQSMGERTEANDEDKAKAEEAINRLLAQNGITDITPQISYPDPDNDTEIKVTLYDSDAGFLLSGFTGGGVGTVERSATARFERCEDGCLKEVDIPPPFQAVNAFGDGDGYKPIPVNDRLYSINHQSGGDRGNQQITCVLRGERELANGTKTRYCWDTPGITAYPGGNIPAKTPEMPHAAVYGSKIYWASSTAGGHYLFCFETETPAPCSSPLRLNSNSHATNLPARLIHRGGGTVLAGEQIYTFTDDHRVHCVIPGDVMTSCGSTPTSLGWLGFPANNPSDGNHGSSIDRIIDEEQGRIYSTIHIDSVPASGPPAFCNSLADNVADPSSGDYVVIKNSSGLYMAVNASNDGLVDGTDPEDPSAHWRILKGTWTDPSTGNNTRVFAYESVQTRNAGNSKYLTITQDTYPQFGEQLTLSEDLLTNPNADSVFIVQHQGSTSRILPWEEYQYPDTTWQRMYLREGVINVDTPEEDFVFQAGEYANGLADWIIRPWECAVEDNGPEMFGHLPYEQGTYLNCHEILTGSSCSGFLATKIHEDWDSFSGRLFFHRNGAGDINGVCSTGFTEHWEWSKNMSSQTQVVCVDQYSGVDLPTMAQGMDQFRNALAAHNTATPNPSENNARWGTWGDPHYNSHSNRMFYPTHRTDSAVLCWDFGTGPCLEGIERVGSSALGEIQDYGFFSEGNCIYGLGHNAIFWAFRADDINEECNGSGKTTSISPCDCGGELFWGTVTFDVTLEQFDEFTIEIRNDDGDRVYPPEGSEEFPIPPHSLIPDAPNVDPRFVGDTVDLNHIPANSKDQRLWVTVAVVAKDGIDPWADGEGSQTFTIEIGRTPRLTD